MTDEYLVHSVPSAPRLLEDRLRLGRRGDPNRLCHSMMMVEMMLSYGLLGCCYIRLSQELLPHFLAHP